MTSRSWRLGRVLTGGATLFVLAFLCVQGCNPKDKNARSELASLVEGVRVTEGRWGGPFKYASYYSSPKYTDSSKIRRAIRKACQSHSQENLASCAVVMLVAGRPGEAVRLLEEARVKAGKHPLLLSNLSAAYVEQFKAEGSSDLRILIQALISVDDALKIKGELVEARFNRALILEKIGLLSPAKEEWRYYLSLDSKSPWAMEARLRLNRLSSRKLVRHEKELVSRLEDLHSWRKNRSTVRKYPQTLQAHVEVKIFRRWAEAWLNKDPAVAIESLAIAEEIGELLAQDHGDRMVKDGVEQIQLALQENRLSDVRTLARAYSTYGRGVDVYLSKGACAAGLLLKEAEVAFSRMNSPFELMAIFYSGICLYGDGKLSDSARVFDYVSHKAQALSYWMLTARCWWMIGLCSMRQGDPNDSLGRYGNALDLLYSRGLLEDVASIQHLMAETYRYLADEDASWRHRTIALTLGAESLDDRRLYPILDEAGNALVESGYLGVGLYFRNAVVDLAKQNQDLEGMSFALTRRAEVLIQLGEKPRALDDLVEARKIVTSAGSGGESTYNQLVRVEMILGELESAGSAARKIAVLTDAINRYKSVGHELFLLKLLRARASAYLRSGNRVEAIKDLRAAVDCYETQQSSIDGMDLRASFFSQVREILSELIRLELQEENLGRAFLYAEHESASILWEGKRRGAMPIVEPVLPDREIRQRLPPDVSLIKYCVLADRLLIWVLRRGSETSFHVRDIGEQELGTLVNEYRSLLLRGDDRAGYVGGKIYQEIISPIRSRLGEHDTLVVVPDGVLDTLPFASLRGVDHKSYLIHEHPIMLSPSASLFVASLGSRRSRGSNDEKVLVIGGPAVSSENLKHLPSLPGAKLEALSVARLYKGRARVFTGMQATEQSFLEEAGEASVIHFAGHAITNKRYPSLSALLFAPDQRGRGVLYAHELRTVLFPKTHLIVLSACSTAGGAGELDSPLGFSGAFLGAGIPAVVVSSLDIDDAATGELLLDFYRELVRDKSPAVAMQKAQIKAADRFPQSEQRWAGIGVIGLLDGLQGTRQSIN